MATSPLPEFQVYVENASGECEVYYCRTKPVLVQKAVISDSDQEEGQVFVKFVPTNGLASRVGRPNFVPFNRLIATVEEDDA